MPSKQTIIVLAVALVAGVALGFAGSTAAYRYGFVRLPGERPVQRMARILNLTPIQLEQVQDIMTDTRHKLEQKRDDFHRQRRECFVDAYIRIRALLTPDQQKIFDNRLVPPRIKAEAQQRARTESGGGALAPTPSPQ